MASKAWNLITQPRSELCVYKNFLYVRLSLFLFDIIIINTNISLYHSSFLYQLMIYVLYNLLY